LVLVIYLLILEIIFCQKFNPLNFNLFANIDLNCGSTFIKGARKFGGTTNIIKAATNKASCYGFSSIDSVITDDCDDNIRKLFQLEIDNNCISKNKCKVKINILDLQNSCPNYLTIDIYMSYSCYGIILNLKI